METKMSKNLKCWLDIKRIPLFFYLLRQGFYLKIRLGSSLEEVLVKDLGIEKEYIQERVQTIFLGHKPVDDLRAHVTLPWQELALSAAMPGLLGATMRKGGYYASFRESISYKESEAVEKENMELKGPILVKLYNLVAQEQGEKVLERGILLSGAQFLDFFDLAQELKSQKVFKSKLDKEEIPYNKLNQRVSADECLFLQVQAFT